MLSYFSTYSPPELRHLSYSRTNFCITVSLQSVTLFCNQSGLRHCVHHFLCRHNLPEFRLADRSTVTPCIECCLVSGIMCTTLVTAVMLWLRNSLPSSWYSSRNVNADSMCFALCSGVSCYALCTQKFYHRPQSAVSGELWKSCQCMRHVTSLLLSHTCSHFTQ